MTIKTFQELLTQATALTSPKQAKKHKELFLDLPIKQYDFFITRLILGASLPQAYHEAMAKEKLTI